MPLVGVVYVKLCKFVFMAEVAGSQAATRIRSIFCSTIGRSKTHIPVRSDPSRASSAKRGEVRSLILPGTAPTAMKHGR